MVQHLHGTTHPNLMTFGALKLIFSFSFSAFANRDRLKSSDSSSGGSFEPMTEIS